MTEKILKYFLSAMYARTVCMRQIHIWVTPNFKKQNRNWRRGGVQYRIPVSDQGQLSGVSPMDKLILILIVSSAFDIQMYNSPFRAIMRTLLHTVCLIVCLTGGNLPVVTGSSLTSHSMCLFTKLNHSYI